MLAVLVAAPAAGAAQLRFELGGGGIGSTPIVRDSIAQAFHVAPAVGPVLHAGLGTPLDDRHELLLTAGWSMADLERDADDSAVPVDPSGAEGWSYFAGDGQATIDLRGTEEGYASIVVDATRDRRNIWWALIKHRVSEDMDLKQLAQPGWELRVEARIRPSHAPRRVNLHVNTQRTTDFHSHLMEFDLPEAGRWYTISMTTRGFPVRPGDAVNAQMALMDWGRGTYRLDVDYFKVDVVEVARAGPDLGEPLLYHPPIPDAETFEHAMGSAESAVIDIANPDVNLGGWSVLEGALRRRLLTVGGTTWVVLRWNLEAFAGRRVADHGLLELTTHSVQRNAEEIKDFALLRVVEILGGDPSWKRDSVTVSSLVAGEARDDVFNPQMVIDWPVTESAGGKTWLTISRPVLQRLIDGRTRGLAIAPLGSIVASFSAGEADGPRLYFNVEN